MFIMNYIFAFSVRYKEVIETTLYEKYNLQVNFSNTRVVCIEKPIGVGNSVEVMGEKRIHFTQQSDSKLNVVNLIAV